MFIMIHFSSMPYLAKLAAKILFFFVTKLRFIETNIIIVTQLLLSTRWWN